MVIDHKCHKGNTNCSCPRITAPLRDVLFSNYCGKTRKRKGLKFGLIHAKFNLFVLQAANAMSEHTLGRQTTINTLHYQDILLLTSLALVGHLKLPEFHLWEKSSQTFVLCPCWWSGHTYDDTDHQHTQQEYKHDWANNNWYYEL